MLTGAAPDKYNTIGPNHDLWPNFHRVYDPDRHQLIKVTAHATQAEVESSKVPIRDFIGTLLADTAATYAPTTVFPTGPATPYVTAGFSSVRQYR